MPRFIILRFGRSLFVHSARNKTNECKEKRRAVNRIQIYGAVRGASFLQPPLFIITSIKNVLIFEILFVFCRKQLKKRLFF